jgi:hypothetical protein
MQEVCATPMVSAQISPFLADERYMAPGEMCPLGEKKTRLFGNVIEVKLIDGGGLCDEKLKICFFPVAIAFCCRK